MNGLQSTKAIRSFLSRSSVLRETKQPIIVGVTGHATHEYFKKGQDSGMNKLVSKPLYIEEFKKILSEFKLVDMPGPWKCSTPDFLRCSSIPRTILQ